MQDSVPGGSSNNFQLLYRDSPSCLISLSLNLPKLLLVIVVFSLYNSSSSLTSFVSVVVTRCLHSVEEILLRQRHCDCEAGNPDFDPSTGSREREPAAVSVSSEQPTFLTLHSFSQQPLLVQIIVTPTASCTFSEVIEPSIPHRKHLSKTDYLCLSPA